MGDRRFGGDWVLATGREVSDDARGERRGAGEQTSPAPVSGQARWSRSMKVGTLAAEAGPPIASGLIRYWGGPAVGGLDSK